MNEETLNGWVEKAKANASGADATVTSGVKVIRNETKSRGTVIMALADVLRPHISKWFDGKYNDEGMLIQPAHVRGFCIEMAERLYKQRYENAA